MKHRLFLFFTTLFLSFNLYAFENNTLTIWMGEGKGAQAVRHISEQFSEQYGVKVIVDERELIVSDWKFYSSTQKGADIIIWAHDRFGEWINDGTIIPVVPKTDTIERILPHTWDAVTHNGSIYGYPITQEAISMIYNKDIISKPPVTWDDVFALNNQLKKDNKRALSFNWSEPYFVWPLFTAYGNYSWKNDNSFYQLMDAGFNHSESLDLLKKLHKENVLSVEDDYNSSLDDFLSGKSALLFNGPWVWEQIKDANIDFGLAPFPVGNKNIVSKPFSGVVAAAINQVSPEKELAQIFIEDYLIHLSNLRKWNDYNSLGTPANKRLLQEVSWQPNIQFTANMAEIAEPMPGVPEISVFWNKLRQGINNSVFTTQNSEIIMATLDDELEKLEKLKAWRRKHYVEQPSY